MPPEPLPPAGLDAISLYLPASLAGIVGQSAQARKLPPSAEAAERIYAAHLSKRRCPTPTTVPNLKAAEDAGGGLSALRGQARAYALETIAGRKIGFIEAATGLGKSRLIAEAASKILSDESKHTVWIVAPTLTILSHLITEAQQTDGFPLSCASVLLGRGQYLDAGLVFDGCRDLLRERATSDAMRDQIHALLQWSKVGGPPSTATSRVFASLIPGLAMTLEDAKALAPDLPLSAWSLAAGAASGTEEGMSDADTLMQSAQSLAQKARVVFATHAMLAARLRLQRIRREPEPLFTHLIVDEAHLLEEAVAASMGYDYHAYAATLWAKRLRNAEGAEAILQETRRVRERLTGLCARLSPGLVTDSSVANSLRQTMVSLARLTRKHQPESETHRALTAITRDDAPLYVTFSPVRRFPTLTTGPGSVRNFLNSLLWSRVTSGLLYSATLYVTSNTGTPSCHYMRIKLGVPPERLAQFQPLIYKGIYTPTIYLPSAEVAATFSYPGSSDLQERDETDVNPQQSASTTRYLEWAKVVSSRIADLSQTALGGTLVLCTSYLDLRTLAGLLPVNLHDRLIDPEGEHTTAYNASCFRQRKDTRPIWISTGAAWTGLDLRDYDQPDAVKDTLLTDLVIVRVPLGLVRTSTQLQRREWFGFESEMIETAIRLKQGLGRLIRRPGLIGRRIHVLDGRLVTLPKAHYKTYRRLIDLYPHQNVF
jgi:ATP-dependent DNA helicase DinG